MKVAARDPVGVCVFSKIDVLLLANDESTHWTIPSSGTSIGFQSIQVVQSPYFEPLS